IRRGSHFFDDFFELFDHLPRFANHLRLIGHVRPQIEQVTTDRIAGRERSDHAIQFVEQRKIRRGLVETFELSAALVAHRKTQSMPESNAIITFLPRLRNVRRCALPKCSTSAVVAQLRKICAEEIVDLAANESCPYISLLRKTRSLSS